MDREPIPEIYKLPIIVTEWDLEYEKMYLEFYNDEFWEEYKRQKMEYYLNKK
tara:strand:+ start:5218 stop:5373 length:156 start_codon:yes stop_codon:yes gene_type:complete